MSIQVLTNYFIEYGAFFIFLIVLLEYLNLPGFPAGVIMPLAGIWAAKGEIGFPMVMLLSVAAGLVGSWALYLLGRLGGTKVMEFYFRKFPKQQPVIEDKMQMIREKGCIGADLTALTGLKHGEFHGMMGIRFLGSLTGLEELKVQGCNVDQPSVIASLPALKKLTYRKNWGNSDDLSFLAGCQGLTYLDMNHSEFYGDVSYAFNLPALETLILDRSSFEVKFDRLQDNPALKALSLNHVKLYKNIEMWSDGMVRSINYDDVLLDEYTSFLGHYPSLEYLSLRGNQLTDLQFAAGLKNLRELDVTDNYVTDTHVLDQLEYLGKDSMVKRPMADVDWIDTVEDSH